MTPVAWVVTYTRRAVAVDFGCASSAAFAGYLFRFGPDGAARWPNVVLALLLPFVWVLWVAATRGYEQRFFATGSDEYGRIFNAGVSLTTAVAILSYATKAEFARGYVVVALPLLTVLNLMGRYGLRKHLHRLRARGECMRRAVAVGHRDSVAGLIRELGRTHDHGIQIVGACLSDGRDDEAWHVPVHGGLDDVVQAVRHYRADTVAVLAGPELDGLALRRLAWALEGDGTQLLVASALIDVAGPRTTIWETGGLPLLHVEHPELGGTRRVLKGTFDKTVAGLALLLALPLFAVIALAIRITDGGPALFAQQRIGRDGRPFRMLKFRSMVVDADRMHARLVELHGDDGVIFKLKDDPRVTRVGRRLRRYSLDELPQLLNVLRGEMSLVGPRPPLPSEVARYAADVHRRLVVKPGLTGLWQISGRSDLSWNDSVRLDLSYVENWSLTLDMLILGKTVVTVVRGGGAY